MFERNPAEILIILLLSVHRIYFFLRRYSKRAKKKGNLTSKAYAAEKKVKDAKISIIKFLPLGQSISVPLWVCIKKVYNTLIEMKL